MKLSLRTSSTWRSARPSTSAGSSFRKASKSSASNFLVGANCHSTGPSLCSRRARPLPMKRSTDSPASASTRRLVAKRLALSENTKSSGVSANQRSNDFAVIVL